MPEKCWTQKNTGMGLQDVTGTEGGSGGREKQLWGTEGETLSMSSATGKKEKESKTQESRGFQSVVRKEYLECLLVASLQMEHAPLMPSLLRPL